MIIFLHIPKSTMKVISTCCYQVYTYSNSNDKPFHGNVPKQNIGSIFFPKKTSTEQHILL